MKKPKLLFKVNQNYTAKVYVGGKWQKDVAAIDIQGIPCNFEVRLLKNKRNAKGCFYTEYDENGEPCIAQETKTYHINMPDLIKGEHKNGCSSRRTGNSNTVQPE